MFVGSLAVISDIHGNSRALREVLEDIHRRGIEDIVNLGDSLYGPLDPAGTAEMLLWLGKPAVSGNEDRLITEATGAWDESPTLRFVKDSLGPGHLRWLKELKKTTVAYEDFFLCHGCPDRDDVYLLQDVSKDGVTKKKPSELSPMLSSVQQPVVLCGHDHVPGVVRLENDKLIVNPGSVGLPAYADYLPFPHSMETGTPHARYSVVSGSERGWRVENVAVPYDWEWAAGVALENGRPDWAEWLRTGRAAAV